MIYNDEKSNHKTSKIKTKNLKHNQKYKKSFQTRKRN